MANNLLTAQQDVLVREFLVEVALAENVLDNNPSMKKSLIRTCYELLNYQRLPDGRFVSKDKKVKYLLGGTVSHTDYPDEWTEDYARALKELNKESTSVEKKQTRNPSQSEFTFDGNDSDEADSGKSSKNPSLWKTLLSKDV